MKKLIIFLALTAFAISGHAEKLYKSSRFFDNWSIGLSAGVQSNLHDWNIPQGSVAGLHLDKQVSPVFGLTLEGYANMNGTPNWAHPTQTHVHGLYNNMVDGAAGLAIGRVSLLNWLGGYKGLRRRFDIEALAGAGYGHTFNTHDDVEADAFMAKAGANFNFVLGRQRAWTLALKPAVVWAALSNCQLDSRHAVGEITMGLTYHMKNANGTHSFLFGRGYDHAEVDELNANINSLRSRLNAKEAELANAQHSIRDLQQALNECRDQKPIIKTVTETKTVVKTNNLPDVLVSFRQGKCIVDPSQLPNVERVASYLKSHKQARVIIKGYASPEGSAEINARIANERAQAVRQVLTERYGISANRIEAEGQGIGDMFSEADWNRVSICTISE